MIERSSASWVGEGSISGGRTGPAVLPIMFMPALINDTLYPAFLIPQSGEGFEEPPEQLVVLSIILAHKGPVERPRDLGGEVEYRRRVTINAGAREGLCGEFRRRHAVHHEEPVPDRGANSSQILHVAMIVLQAHDVRYLSQVTRGLRRKDRVSPLVEYQAQAGR